jgi:hypothetical protein
VLRRTPSFRQNVSATMPMSVVGVDLGSKTVSPSVIVGITSVPSGPTA